MAAAASSSMKRFTFTYIILIINLLSQSKHTFACFKSIISFGDSLADTGNARTLPQPSNKPSHSALPPYGETYFHHPTGRFSDGRLIIDFIAQDLRLPFVSPFHGGENVSIRNFHGGVNFAVAGATALPDSFFREKGISIPFANVSLMAQLSWFKDIILPTFCQKPADCEIFFKTSLVLVGEIGGNDYNHAFTGGKSVDEVRLFVPEVVKTISLTIKELIKLGAVTLMVPGNFPIGCLAAYLTKYKNTSKETDYDPKTGCLNWLNIFSQHHNELLQSELNLIRKQNPNINIIYADYYNAAMQVHHSPKKYGFAEGTLRACCGAGGPYNVNLTMLCGDQGTKSCEDPSLYVNWDGVHLTEAAYRWIANGLLRGSFTTPLLKSVCAHQTTQINNEPFQPNNATA